MQDPTIVGENYVFNKVIGRGGFSTVLLATKRGGEFEGKPFAIKAVQKGQVWKGTPAHRRASLEKKILREYAAECPFSVKLFTIYETPSCDFIILDYCVGGSLSFHLRAARRKYRDSGNTGPKTFGEERIKFYAVEIVLAIRFLHSKGILHRDLKPSNILLDNTGHIRVTDFGTCRDMRLNLEACPEFEATRLGTKLGTADYMAPEMLRGVPYGKGIDWWSFGIMMYELLIGRPPFFHKDDNVMMQLIQDDSPVILTCKTISEESRSFLGRLLQKDPAQRIGYQANGSVEVLEHRWFNSLRSQFTNISTKKISPPWIPKLTHDHDTSNMNTTYTEQKWDPRSVGIDAQTIPMSPQASIPRTISRRNSRGTVRASPEQNQTAGSSGKLPSSFGKDLLLEPIDDPKPRKRPGGDIMDELMFLFCCRD